MPETMTTFQGSSWSVWIAICSARRTAKSPHPGHHVGLSRTCTCPSRPRVSCDRLQDLVRDVSPGKGLAIVFPEEVVRLVAGLRAEEPRELAGVVALDCEALFHVLEEGERRVRMEREQGRELQAVHPDSTSLDVLDRLVGGAPGGTPVDQGEVRVLGSPELRGRCVFPQTVELPHPLLVHPISLGDVFRDAGEDVGDELAVLHVLVRRGDELISFHARNRPRTHAALREAVSLEVLHLRAIGRGHAADDRDVEVRLLDRAVAFAEVEIRDHDDRRLIDFREVEGPRGEAEAFFRVAGRQDRARPISLARTEGEVQVPLLRLRWQSGRRTAALPVIRSLGSFGYASPKFREPPISPTASPPSFAAWMFCCTISGFLSPQISLKALSTCRKSRSNSRTAAPRATVFRISAFGERLCAFFRRGMPRRRTFSRSLVGSGFVPSVS